MARLGKSLKNITLSPLICPRIAGLLFMFPPSSGSPAARRKENTVGKLEGERGSVGERLTNV